MTKTVKGIQVPQRADFVGSFLRPQNLSAENRDQHIAALVKRQKEAGFKNAYRREHTKDRQTKTTQPTISKFQTKNLSKNIANNTAIQYVNETRTEYLTERQLKDIYNKIKSQII